MACSGDRAALSAVWGASKAVHLTGRGRRERMWPHCCIGRVYCLQHCCHITCYNTQPAHKLGCSWATGGAAGKGAPERLSRHVGIGSRFVDAAGALLPAGDRSGKAAKCAASTSSCACSKHSQPLAYSTTPL